MAHFWPDGIAISAYCNRDGLPSRLFVDGRRHKVQEIVRRWRIEDEWWQTPIVRDYYKLITDSGLLLIIYDDGEQWYLQRLYD